MLPFFVKMKYESCCLSLTTLLSMHLFFSEFGCVFCHIRSTLWCHLVWCFMCCCCFRAHQFFYCFLIMVQTAAFKCFVYFLSCRLTITMLGDLVSELLICSRTRPTVHRCWFNFSIAESDLFRFPCVTVVVPLIAGKRSTTANSLQYKCASVSLRYTACQFSL